MLAILTILAQSGGQGSTLAAFLPFLLIGGMMYFLMIRPQRQRQRAQQALLNSLEVGDEVMTTGGIFGTVRAMDEDEGTVTIEIAPGTTIRMVRQGISRRLTEDREEWQDDEDDGSEEADSRP